MEHKIEYMKKVMENEPPGVDEHLTTIQKQLKSPQGMWRIAPKLREKYLQRTPDDVRTREEAAARCTKVKKTKSAQKPARKAKAQHLVKCNLAPGTKRF